MLNLAQLKIAPEGAAPEAEIEPLIAMGEQVLADGDAARAANIFAQVREMAPENPEVHIRGERDSATACANTLGTSITQTRQAIQLGIKVCQACLSMGV